MLGGVWNLVHRIREYSLERVCSQDRLSVWSIRPCVMGMGPPTSQQHTRLGQTARRWGTIQKCGSRILARAAALGGGDGFLFHTTVMTRLSWPRRDEMSEAIQSS